MTDYMIVVALVFLALSHFLHLIEHHHQFLNHDRDIDTIINSHIKAHLHTYHRND